MQSDLKRLGLAADASGEIMCIVAMLQRESGNDGFDDLVRGSLIRIRDLASVALSVTGNDLNRSSDEMEQVVFGSNLTKAAV